VTPHERLGRTGCGLLHRRLVASVRELYIGKESNRLEEARSGLLHELDVSLSTYMPADVWDRVVRPVLQQIPATWLRRKTGMSRRTIQRLRNGHADPRAGNEASLTAAAAAFARGKLEGLGHPSSLSDLAALQAFLEGGGQRFAPPRWVLEFNITPDVR
jgi:hypothetical protein